MVQYYNIYDQICTIVAGRCRTAEGEEEEKGREAPVECGREALAVELK